MRAIFLIAGKAQHGKDSTANIIKNNIGGKTMTIHFADLLKNIARDYLNWDGSKDIKGRTLLQWLGTDRVRKEMQWDLFWANNVCDTIKIVEDKFDYCCIPDCRFPNECYLPKARFSNMPVICIHVKRLNFDNGLSNEQKSHPSEISLDNFKFDYYINSESGLNNLEKEVLKFIDYFKEVYIK